MDWVETEHLVLRLWREEDYESFAQFYASESEAKYVGGKKIGDEVWRHFALLIGHWQIKGFGYWAVEEKETQKFVGSVGLWQSEGWPELELGYWMTKDHQGKGYAKEAGARAKVIASDVLKSPSLVSYIDPDNEPSKRLAKSLGAEYEKTIELLKYGPHCVYRHF